MCFSSPSLPPAAPPPPPPRLVDKSAIDIRKDARFRLSQGGFGGTVSSPSGAPGVARLVSSQLLGDS